MKQPRKARKRRAEASAVRVGMDRPAVEGILGRPHGSMSMPEDHGDDKGKVKVRLEKGKVVSVKLLD